MAFHKAVRIITVAPVMALITLILMFAIRPHCIGGTLNFIMSAVFLFVLPVAAYPLQPVLPHFKNGGRKAQRDLAIIMAVVGYIGGIIYAFAAKTPHALTVFFMTYLLSGVLMVLFNKVFKIKASGHACGVVGPIAYMCVFLSPFAALGAVLVFPVFYSSVRMKRHTPAELICGALLPVASLLISMLLIR